jgi:hypothetical protein
MSHPELWLLPKSGMTKIKTTNICPQNQRIHLSKVKNLTNYGLKDEFSTLISKAYVRSARILMTIKISFAVFHARDDSC